MLACRLSLVLLRAIAKPLRWRDGYVVWRGKFFKPDGRTFKLACH
jgi:hypothetical protein